MNLMLDPQYIQFIVAQLNELPTKTGAFLVVQEIERQIRAQQEVKEATDTKPTE